jgi:hypothetical protein
MKIKLGKPIITRPEHSGSIRTRVRDKINHRAGVTSNNVWIDVNCGVHHPINRIVGRLSVGIASAVRAGVAK